MFRSLRLIAFTLVLLMLSAGSVAAQVLDATSAEFTIRGTIESVDLKARTVHIRGEEGNLIVVDVPESATRLDQVHKGDAVTASYYSRVQIRPKPAGEPAVDRRIPPTATPSPGSLPGGTLATQRVATATITGWDPTNRMLTYRLPSGESYIRFLLETTDASIVSGVKVGDRYDVTWTEAVRFAVQPAPDTLRNRLTFSVLLGWDNQFSGKVIAPIQGTMPSGVPISTSETTYDQVYGAMGLFKIGVGYRTSPRTEGVFNVVFSRGGSEPVTIGQVGTENAPITAKFDDYRYWGLEGGQRLYFARVRFTPYVGYILGLNHHSKINGTFTAPPTASQPGIAINDAAFFDPHWAFSFSPTGGVLVGVGPIEVQAEIAMRYISGLSDVNALVNIGLKDVNVDSSRWSVPVLFGARLRF